MLFRRYWKIMVSLVVIAALALALVNGMFNAWQSLDLSIGNYLREYGIADAVLSTDVTDTDVAEAIRQVDGVERVVARLTGSSRLVTPSGTELTAQIISMDKEDILRLHHWADSEVPSGDYVLVDNWFAKHNGISAGDILQIRTGEEEYRPFTVAAVVSAPETLERSKMNLGGSYYPDFGFVYAPISLLATETEKELLRMTEEWKGKEAEYLQAEKEMKDAWESGQAELAEAWSELEKQEKDFQAKQEDLKAQINDLTQARVQLTLGRKELDDGEKTAEQRKEQLEAALERTTAQLLELEDRQADLSEVRNDLSSLLVRLEDAKGRLAASRDQISGTEAQLQSTIRIMKSARSAWQRVRSSDADTELPDEFAEQGYSSVADLESGAAALGLTPKQLDSWISQAEGGAAQLAGGRNRIQNGILQINQDYLPEVRNYLEESERGLETVAEIHETLQAGIADLESGLQAISDFEQEAPENRAEIDQKLQEVEEGLQAIYGGLQEGETALSEGRQQLEEKTAEAAEAHTEAEAELESGAGELQKAWEELSAWKGYTPLRNEFLIWFSPEVTDHRQALLAVEQVLAVPVQNSELYSDSRVAKIIYDNLDPLWSMSVFVPLLFVGIMMAVLFLFLSIMIRQSRQHIGILRALGISLGRIRRVFSVTCVLLMLAAAVLGGASSLLITGIFNRYNESFLSIPSFVDCFSWPVFALSTAVFVLLSLVAVWISSGTLAGIQPAEAVSRRVAVPPKVGRLSRFLLRGCSPLSKFSLLSLKRRPFRFVASVVCISGAVSMIFASFSFLVSKNEILKEVFDRQIRYDAQVLLAEEPDTALLEEIRALDSVAAAEPFLSREEELSFGGKSVRGTLVFLEPDTVMVSLTDPQGRPMGFPEEGIVLSGTVAETLGVKAGDTVLVGRTETVVAGVSRQLTAGCQYLPAKDAGRYRTAGQAGLMLRLRDGADGADVLVRFSRREGYITTVWRALMQKSYSELFESYDMYTWLLVILCAVVGIFIVVTTGRNNLQEQKLSLSVLRVVGFRREQISAHWFLQSLLVFLFSLILGFLVGKITAVKSLELLSNSSRRLEYVHSLYQYGMAAACTFVFLLVGHLITMRNMKHWDLVQNTKGRE